MAKKKSKTAPFIAPDRERYAMITISLLGNKITGSAVIEPSSSLSASLREFPALEFALPDLAEGGYVFDYRPLIDHPKITTWITDEPYFNGQLEGDTITSSRRNTPLTVKPTYDEDGVFDGGASGYDYVSASYLVKYWTSRGARVGKREGMVIKWSDGTEEPIPSTTDDQAKS